MYERKKKGMLAEQKVLLHLIENDYEVYRPINSNAKFDFIIEKLGKIETVSVKYTSQHSDVSWIVELRNVSRRNNGEVNISKFDASSIDWLAVYIAPEDRVEMIYARELKNTNCLNISFGRLTER